MRLETIVGHKVLLRPISMDDTDLIIRWRNHPAVQENFIFRKEMTPEMHHHWMNTKVASGEVVQYIIVVKDTNTPIGSVYFRDIDPDTESAEFGIFIGEDTGRGNGYGSEATSLFVQFGLSELGLHRISLRVLSHNHSAVHIYEKAGFQHEGLFRDMVKLDGKFSDVIFMAVIAQ